jgi:hypothetical protein
MDALQSLGKFPDLWKKNGAPDYINWTKEMFCKDKTEISRNLFI